MAEVKLSGIGIVDINGSVNGTTFARNKYGIYAKTKIPGPAGTPALALWQANVAFLSDMWRNTLSNDERETWYTISQPKQDRMADREPITGFQLFMSVNLNLMELSLTPVNTPPIYEAPAYIDGMIVTYTPFVTIQLDWILKFITAAPAVTGMVIYATNYLPAGRMSTNQIYARIDFAVTTPGAGFTNLFVQVTTKYGAIQSGSKMFFAIDPISTSGRRGVRAYTSLIFP